ncbi:FtsX-like permease family protein [Nitritalea halalkaliphila]|uniref:FtsX-like permease family protein n=1 Tax=Nitritalea halalkaliphila TaxID=590849 RepID=UPI000301CC44|nr:FtsX-like permease family protein [Nitritalea halalkaliphila]
MVNLGSILETLEEVLGKISLVIRFMALFSIATGILVLISSLIMSKYQRLYESILLRTLGASSARVAKIQTLEYFFLGSLAALSGVFISVIASYLLSVHVFQIPFRWTLPEALFVYAAITGLTVLLGWLNGRSAKDTAPIAILRG